MLRYQKATACAPKGCVLARPTTGVSIRFPTAIPPAVRYLLQDMGDLKIEERQRWNIPLIDFNDVNLASIELLYLGSDEIHVW